MEQALSGAMPGHKMHPPASLEALVCFAANPIPLGAIKIRMRLHELLTKVCTIHHKRAQFPVSSKLAVGDKLINMNIVLLTLKGD